MRFADGHDQGISFFTGTMQQPDQCECVGFIPWPAAPLPEAERWAMVLDWTLRGILPPGATTDDKE